MEIEYKYLINELPQNLETYPHKLITQGYISSDPVIRIRHIGDKYVLTIKGQGTVAREEYELSLTSSQFEGLKVKIDGYMIEKTRYFIPYDSHTIELDIFQGAYDGLYFAEVEFESMEDAKHFQKPNWFGENVSEDTRYHNSRLSQGVIDFLKK